MGGYYIIIQQHSKIMIAFLLCINISNASGKDLCLVFNAKCFAFGQTKFRASHKFPIEPYLHKLNQKHQLILISYD